MVMFCQFPPLTLQVNHRNATQTISSHSVPNTLSIREVAAHAFRCCAIVELHDRICPIQVQTEISSLSHLLDS